MKCVWANSTISPGFPKHEFRNTLHASISESVCPVGHTKHSWSNRALLFSSNLSLFMGFPGGSDSKESACNEGDLDSIPGFGRSLEEGMVTHSSILAWRICMDRGAWQTTVHGGYKESNVTEQLSTAQNIIASMPITGLPQWLSGQKNPPAMQES